MNSIAKTFWRFLTKKLRLKNGQDAPQRSYRWQGGERPSRREAQAVPTAGPPARGARALCGGSARTARGGSAAVPEASRAGRGAAPLRRAGARVAGHLHHHQAGPRGLAPRGRAAAHFGLVAFGVCRFACAR